MSKIEKELIEENASNSMFKFKQFAIHQDQCPMKVGTDGVLLGAWVDVSNTENILDIGTGTGLIAIMLAQRTEAGQIDAVEIDNHACNQAKMNMEASPWSDRLNSIESSIQDFAKLSQKEYDLIVSNPPFFTGGTLSDQNDRNNVRHTVKLPNGDLLSSARRLLKKEGRFCVVLPLIEGLRFKELAQNYNFYCTKMTRVKPKHDKSVERLLLQFEQTQKPLEENELVIQHEKRNDYTEDYIDLTKDFYLKM